MRQLKTILAALLVIDILAAGWVAVKQTWIDYVAPGARANLAVGNAFLTAHHHPELHLGWWQSRPTVLTLVVIAALGLAAAVGVALLPHPALAVSAGAVGAVAAACFAVHGHPSFDTVRFGPYALHPGVGTGLYAGIIAVGSALALGLVVRHRDRYAVRSQTLPATEWVEPGELSHAPTTQQPIYLPA